MALAWGAALAVACATYTDKNELMRHELDNARLEDAVDAANDSLKVRKADQLPKKWKKNTGLAVLERATIFHALGWYELAARDFSKAEEQLELMDISIDAGGNIARWVYSESASKYRTPPSERLALNAINLENYLMRGDLDGAKIEAKRFTVMRNYLLDHDPEHAYGEFGSYMAGFVFERLGAADEALRYYDEALQARDFASLREPIARLKKKGSYSSPRIDAYAKGSPAPPPKSTPSPADDAEDDANDDAESKDDANDDAESKDDAVEDKSEAAEGEGASKDEADDSPAAESKTEASASTDSKDDSDDASKTESSESAEGSGAVPAAAPLTESSEGGEILVVIKLGRVPHKEPVRIPIGAAIGIGAAYITGDTTILEQGMLKFIVFPELVPSTDLYDGARVFVDGRELGVELASNMGSQVVREFEELKPRIIGSALTRMITRAVASGGIQAAGNSAAKGSENGGTIAALAFLGALAVEGTMVALDKPDTRSWTTLPARVYISRARIPAGKHSVVIQTVGSTAVTKKTVDLDMKEGGFAAIDFTTLR